jgi:hypothetical protein
MKNLLLALSVVAVLFSGCKKEDNDLTKNVVGHFTNSTTSTDVVVNKVDNNTVSLTLTTGSGSGEYTIGFPTAKMSSANAFTLDPVTQTGNGCDGTQKWSGTGTASNNNIALFISVDGTGTGSPYDCDDWTDNVAASK